MSQTWANVNEAIPLYLGTTLTGWVSSRSFTEQEGTRRTVEIMTGDQRFPIKSFLLAARLSESTHDSKTSAFITTRMAYPADITVIVPSGAVDVEADKISYSDRTVESLKNALYNYFLSFDIYMESQVNGMSPSEVTNLYAVLASRGSSRAIRSKMKWRGTPLNDKVLQSRMIFRDRGVFPATRSTLEVLSDMGTFENFLITKGLIYAGKSPKPVFYVAAQTRAEELLGEKLFTDEILDAYLQDSGMEHGLSSNHIFFLGSTESPLSEWVLGETVSVQQLLAVATKKNLC